MYGAKKFFCRVLCYNGKIIKSAENITDPYEEFDMTDKSGNKIYTEKRLQMYFDRY